MAQRRTGSTLIFIGTLLLGIALFALVMIVMGIRLEKDVSPREPSPQDVERQQLAARAQEIAHSGGDYASFGEDWTTALGGVWIPWPDGAPDGYTNPPIPENSFDDVHSALLELSEATLNSDLGPVTTAIGISTLSLGASEPDQCGEYDLATVAGAANSGVAVENVEIARQWLEQHAAQLEVGARDSEIERIDMLSNLIDAQLAAGAPDTRPALVAEPAGDSHVEAAYKLLIDQLAFSAMNASGAQADVASFICHLNQFQDAPRIEPFPGLDLLGTSTDSEQN
ncbi:hypothetical protein J2S70_001542 [Trueperella bonasi]|uniref:DUF4439 domain-containing protein n=1 Tax=Trueperella bonasi TaxID=312286 RepID=A0ABT9NHT5_9ACTO|nr:hypothetical protein [Trueperella bonasi]MDP9806960.1 hypothetical protein [Trueperella bonasi]